MQPTEVEANVESSRLESTIGVSALGAWILQERREWSEVLRRLEAESEPDGTSSAPRD